MLPSQTMLSLQIWLNWNVILWRHAVIYSVGHVWYHWTFPCFVFFFAIMLCVYLLACVAAKLDSIPLACFYSSVASLFTFVYPLLFLFIIPLISPLAALTLCIQSPILIAIFFPCLFISVPLVLYFSPGAYLPFFLFLLFFFLLCLTCVLYSHVHIIYDLWRVSESHYD